MGTDELRARADAQEELATALFEAQFTLCGDRMPADPTWEDLDEAQRDDFRGEAQRARVVLDAALAARAAGVESVTEWGVRWSDNGAVTRCATEWQARTNAKNDPKYGPIVVSRTVTRTEWRTVNSEVRRSDAAEPGATCNNSSRNGG